jgi:5-methylcytosine-specific restriction endonuclease McrA
MTIIPHTKIRSALRKLWMFQNTAKVRSRARLSRGTYRCEGCGSLATKVEVDHVIPLGPTPGSRNATPEITWDGFIARLFCPPDQLQVLCTICHDVKTGRRGVA